MPPKTLAFSTISTFAPLPGNGLLRGLGIAIDPQHLAFDQRRPHDAGMHRIDADIVARQSRRQRRLLTGIRDCRFAGPIGRRIGRTDIAGDRTDIDHRAATIALHVPDGCTRAQKGAVRIDLEQTPPCRIGKILEGIAFGADHPGTVHQQFDAAVTLLDTGNDRIPARLVRDVESDGVDVIHWHQGLVLIGDVGQDDARALRPQLPGDGLAESAVSARDQCQFVVIACHYYACHFLKRERAPRGKAKSITTRRVPRKTLLPSPPNERNFS